jgi:Ca-activated chloride channel family protein
MTPPTRRTLAVVAACALLVPVEAPAQTPAETQEKTPSPYIEIDDGEAVVDRLPLKDTRVNVSIAGAIADVTVRQVYENAGERPVHARYVFPAPPRAAVYGMTMTVGKARMVANVREREQASREFDRAKQEGKNASLLEQSQQNVFTIDVANLLPGDAIAVELAYTELLTHTDGQYEFTFPTVVGPGHSETLESQPSQDDSFVEAPHVRHAEAPRGRFHLAVMLSTGVPIRGLVSPSHRMVIRSIGQGRAEMALADAERESGNRDFILRYRLGKSIGSALLLDKGRDESFFLLLAEPPQAVLPGGTQTAPPPSDLDSPVLTDINVTFRAFETYDVEPAGLPDLFARRPIVVFGKWKHTPGNLPDVRGRHPGRLRGEPRCASPFVGASPSRHTLRFRSLDSR